MGCADQRTSWFVNSAPRDAESLGRVGPAEISILVNMRTVRRNCIPDIALAVSYYGYPVQREV